ncbi:MAG: D-alanyl-D-alanine carboxypeptidase [Methanothrix sp.]|nr:D-alanyl-D-alanine carboxypeptidase [Methanothrix sp.]
MRKQLVIILAVILFVTCSGLASAQDFDLPAGAAILIDADTGQVLFAKNEHEQMPPASIVKLMTTLLVLEAVDSGRASLDDVVITSQYASQVEGSKVFLASGESHPLEKMMQAVTIYSGNDATVAVAEYLGGTEANFVRLMNERAQELGMKNTYFIDSNGLPIGDLDNASTAYDIALLSREVVKHPKALEWSSTEFAIFREKPRFDMPNRNRLIKAYPGADGLKTGYTSAAGYCLVGTAKKGDLRLISVVLKTDSDDERLQQTMRLLDYGFSFDYRDVVSQGKLVGQLDVLGGRSQKVDMAAGEDVRLLAARGERDPFEVQLVMKEALQAPINKGDVVGTMTISYRGRVAKELPVVAAEEVARAGFFTRLLRTISGWFK